MVRPTQRLFPQREPAATRAAATVLLLRDGAQGMELLMTRRSVNASFAPGAYVFPGGAVDAEDGRSADIAPRRAGQSEPQLTQAVAAVRECFEELGILLARRGDGSPVDGKDLALLDRRGPFAALCRQHGLVLNTDRVYLLARWITDRDLPRRFDVPFVVARMPEGQSAVADETEQFEPVWVRPTQALEQHQAGNFFIIFPTIRTLERLRDYPSVEALLQACAASEAPLWTSCPRAGFLAGKAARYMEHEPPYGELELVSPDGQMVQHLDWRHDQAVGLLKNLLRLTAANPGLMTGPGTNSYLVGDADTGFMAIDPGPADALHLERLWREAGGDIRIILCTHSHPDHSPGARPLQALCAEHGKRPPILGLPSAPSARAASEFVPDRVLQDGELLVLQGGDQVHTLQVMFTPGHAANHLCLILLEDGLLFSGDHILNGSTTIVDPPDGDMSAYLESLDRLDAACVQHDIQFILPAHGYVLGQARAAIAQLKAHRLKREAKVLAAMRSKPDGSLEDWVALAYQDVPPRLWPVAARSLLAHVQRIQALAANAS